MTDVGERAVAELLARPDTHVVGTVGDAVVAVADPGAVYEQCLMLEFAALRDRLAAMFGVLAGQLAADLPRIRLAFGRLGPVLAELELLERRRVARLRRMRHVYRLRRGGWSR